MKSSKPKKQKIGFQILFEGETELQNQGNSKQKKITSKNQKEVLCMNKDQIDQVMDEFDFQQESGLFLDEQDIFNQENDQIKLENEKEVGNNQMKKKYKKEKIKSYIHKRKENEEDQIKYDVFGNDDSHFSYSICDKKLKRRLTRSFLPIAKKFFWEYHKLQEAGRLPRGLTLRKFAKDHQYSSSTIYLLHQKWMEDPMLLQVQQCFSPDGKDKRFRGKSEISKLRQAFVLQLLEENPLLYAHQIMKRIGERPQLARKSEENYPKTENYKGHNKFLTNIFKENSLQKYRIQLLSSRRNTEADFNARYAYCDKMSRILQNYQYEVYYIDEYPINTYFGRQRAWGMPGKQFANVMINLRKESVLLIAIMGANGLVKHTLTNGDITESQYMESLEMLFAKIIKKTQKKKILLVINHAVGPIRTVIQEFATQNQLKFIYLPDFSPQLNPLSFWFFQVRLLLKKKKFSNNEQLHFAIKKSLDQMAHKEHLNFFEESKQYFKRGLHKEQF